MECYPIPKIDDLLTSLSGGVVFSKLDMSQAYQQVELDDASKKLVVINTQKGLFRYTRLPFGVSSVPAIFQRVMESLLQGIPNVVVYFDDILVAGKSVAEHLTILDRVLSRLQEAGLRLRKNKCQFLVLSVTYLGYIIDKEGIHPTPEKIKAIKEAPHPKNVTELKSYLGLLSCYNRFMPHLPTISAPLYKLLHKDSIWQWSADADKAFLQSQELLTSDDVLIHFIPDYKLILACDASPYGVGAVLAHEMPDGSERPIAFASRTLSDTEKRYGQIEKEGLACVYGVKKFHCYLYGRNFTLQKDHKPLLSLFNGNQAISIQSSARIQLWALTLAAYEFSFRHKYAQNHMNADALSRLPLNVVPAETPLPPELIVLMDYVANSPVTAKQIAQWTKSDLVLGRVLQYVNTGWPDECPNKELKPYWIGQSELSVMEGCILWSSRVIVPLQGRNQLLSELHNGHFSIAKTKGRARSCVWWPGLDGDIERIVSECDKCQQTKNCPSESKFQSWPYPAKPWSRIHIDCAGPIDGVMHFQSG